MMQEVEVLKTIQELICSFFSEEQFTLSKRRAILLFFSICAIMQTTVTNSSEEVKR